jgi:aspartate racemase
MCGSWVAARSIGRGWDDMTKTIGIIGGMGPASTWHFYRRIVSSTSAVADQEHLHVIIDSDPYVPDRAEFLAGNGRNPLPQLIAMAQRLEQSGAEILVMACNSASPFTAGVARSVTVPIIDWVQEATNAFVASYPDRSHVGLLAADGSIAAGVYRRSLSTSGRSTVIPSAPHQEQLMRIIRSIKAGRAELSSLRSGLGPICSALVANGAQALLVACTELSLLGDDEIPAWGVPVFDSAQAVAERLILLAGGSTRRLPHRLVTPPEAAGGYPGNEAAGSGNHPADGGESNVRG